MWLRIYNLQITRQNRFQLQLLIQTTDTENSVAKIMYSVSSGMCFLSPGIECFKPLKGRGVNWLHLAIQV